MNKYKQLFPVLMGKVAASAPWYIIDGVSESNIVALYMPSDSTSLADSYLRKVGTGGNASLDPAIVGGVAPVWSKLGGWRFDGADDYLKTGVVPSANCTVIVAASESGKIGASALFGTHNGTTEFVLYPLYGTSEGGAAGSTAGKFGSTSLDTQAPASHEPHIFAMSTNGRVLYKDGTAFKSMTTGTIPNSQFYIGCEFLVTDPSRFLPTNVQAFMVLDIGLTATQVAAMTAALSTRLALLSKEIGAWTWFGRPTVVRHSGSSNKTYIGSIGSTGNAKVFEYNHTTSVMSKSVILKTGKPDLLADDHGPVSLLVRASDSKLMAWYCKHNGSYIYQRVSTNAEDSSTWAAEASIAGSFASAPYTYPSPIQLTGEANNPIYLFYRGYIGGAASLMCSISTNEGTTWGAPLQVFANPGYIPYYSVINNGNDRIDVTVSDAHPNQLATNSVYHFYRTGGNWYKSDGTLIGDDTALPLETADVTKAYDGTTNSSFIWDIAIDGSGNPTIVFASFPGQTFNTVVPDHRYNQARWNGSSWSSYEICAAGAGLYSAEKYYSGGIAIDHANVDIVYCSRYVSGQWEIFKYTTADSGVNWTLSEQLTTGSLYPNIRPLVPINSAAGLKVIWMNGTYNSFTDYYTYIKSDPQY